MVLVEMEATKSVFCQTFGDAPYVRVLDFFLSLSGIDYSKSHVAQETGVSRVTLGKIWMQLEKDGIIRRTRGIGRAELYSLNKESPRAKALLEMDFRLSKAFAEEQEMHSSQKIAVKARG